MSSQGNPTEPQKYTPEEILEMQSMIDDVYEIVEVWGFEAKYQNQKEWAHEWMAKARKYGARPDW